MELIHQQHHPFLPTPIRLPRSPALIVTTLRPQPLRMLPPQRLPHPTLTHPHKHIIVPNLPPHLTTHPHPLHPHMASHPPEKETLPSQVLTGTYSLPTLIQHRNIPHIQKGKFLSIKRKLMNLLFVLIIASLRPTE